MRIEDIAIPMSEEERRAKHEAIRLKGVRSREVLAEMIRRHDERAVRDDKE